jgi:hypothetical protein
LDWFVGGNFRDNFVRISLGLAGMPPRTGRTFARHHDFPDAPRALKKFHCHPTGILQKPSKIGRFRSFFCAMGWNEPLFRVMQFKIANKINGFKHDSYGMALKKFCRMVAAKNSLSNL